MDRKTVLCRLATIAIFTLGIYSAAAKSFAAAPQIPVEVQVFTTMPSTDAHSPVMAMDGDLNTYYKSDYGMDDGDDFIVLLSRPIPVSSIKIVTGDTDGDDLLTNAVVDTSPDTTTYTKSGAFDAQGIASITLKGKPVMGLRIHVIPGQGASSLVIREITFDSPDKITHVVQGPGRGFIDYSRAPEVAAWAARAEAQMEAFWPDIDALLYSPGFIPPNAVNVVYRTGPGVTGVAATGGGVMTVNTAWCDAHPDDTGLTVHETAHVVQAFASYDPVWLIEGEADYIRWVKFEPQNYKTRINPKTATYHDSYRTTASFLGWCENHYDNTLVTQLNRAVRIGAYNNGLFKQYCGKDVDTLWAEFIAAYQADPADILTPPMPAADRPRVLPIVAAGTSTTVDLSVAFNTVGISKDGTAVPASGGMDGEGSTYSADSLGTTQTWKNIKFSLGPGGASDTITAAGNVLPLPAGTFGSIWLLGTSVEGNAMAQTFTVTYTDGTTQDLAQNLSDWFQPQSFPGEGRAIKSPYRNMYDGSKDSRPFNIYAYGFSLNSAKTVKSITLPNSPNVKIMAITLAAPSP